MGMSRASLKVVLSNRCKCLPTVYTSTSFGDSSLQLTPLNNHQSKKYFPRVNPNNARKKSSYATVAGMLNLCVADPVSTLLCNVHVNEKMRV